MKKNVFYCVCYWVIVIFAFVYAFLQFGADEPVLGTVWIVAGVIDIGAAIIWTKKLIKERRENKQ